MFFKEMTLETTQNICLMGRRGMTKKINIYLDPLYLLFILPSAAIYFFFYYIHQCDG